jgi:hypothetical protein
MKKINRILMLTVISLLFTSSVTSLAQKKYLILAEGNDWLPIMPKNLVKNHKTIAKLPFDGFVVVGNSYTNIVMTPGTKLQYNRVWSEVKALKNLYKHKRNFLQINVAFPGDFWDDKVWQQTTENFAIVAKAAKQLGFTGIIFDDEPYNDNAQKMCNFKFPTRAEIKQAPGKYKEWEKRGQESKWVDEKSYRNMNYSFKAHMDKISLRFKTIMQAMVKEFPDITVLVYNGPSFAHQNSNKKQLLVVDVGLPREHEYLGPMFAGLQAATVAPASLYDMGESYKYRRKKEFEASYQWRKYGIAKDRNNDNLNPDYNWVIPKNARSDWAKNVQVGFMVFNKGQASSYPQYDTRKRSTIKDIKKSLSYALAHSDKYAIYYCHEQDWLLPQRKKYIIPKAWRKMMRELARERR